VVIFGWPSLAAFARNTAIVKALRKHIWEKASVGLAIVGMGRHHGLRPEQQMRDITGYNADELMPA